MSGAKRSFPYYSSVPEISLKKRGVEGINPGRENKSAELFELPDIEPSEAVSQTGLTGDAISWSVREQCSRDQMYLSAAFSNRLWTMDRRPNQGLIQKDSGFLQFCS